MSWEIIQSTEAQTSSWPLLRIPRETVPLDFHMNPFFLLVFFFLSIFTGFRWISMHCFFFAVIAAIADIGGSKNWWEVSGPTSHIYTYYNTYIHVTTYVLQA